MTAKKVKEVKYTVITPKGQVKNLTKKEFAAYKKKLK